MRVRSYLFMPNNLWFLASGNVFCLVVWYGWDIVSHDQLLQNFYLELLFTHYIRTTSSPGPSPRSKWRSEKTPGQGCQSGSKSSLEFRHANTMKCLRFVWITVSDCRKQTGLPDAGNNHRKSRFIVCHVTKYYTIRGVFQQPWPGVSPTAYFERGEGPGDEVDTRTLWTSHFSRSTGLDRTVSSWKTVLHFANICSGFLCFLATRRNFFVCLYCLSVFLFLFLFFFQ